MARVAVIYDSSELRDHRTADGRSVPSVTQVLKADGRSADFSQVPFATLERKRQIGKAAHMATHYYDEGDLVLSTVDAEVLPYLRAWMLWKAEYGFRPLMLETVVTSSFEYVGCFDRFGVSTQAPGRYMLPDIKIGNPSDAAAHLQTAGYEEALREYFPEFAAAVIDRLSVQLCPDGRYKVFPYRNRSDRNEFLAAVRRVHARTAENGGVPCWMF